MFHISINESIYQHDEIDSEDGISFVCYGPVRFNFSSGHRIWNIFGHLKTNDGRIHHFSGADGIFIFNDPPIGLFNASYNHMSGHVFLTWDKYRIVDEITVSYNFTEMPLEPISCMNNPCESIKWIKEGF